MHLMFQQLVNMRKKKCSELIENSIENRIPYSKNTIITFFAVILSVHAICNILISATDFSILGYDLGTFVPLVPIRLLTSATLFWSVGHLVFYFGIKSFFKVISIAINPNTNLEFDIQTWFLNELTESQKLWFILGLFLSELFYFAICLTVNPYALG